ncbi:MAG: hypothetical protein ACI8XO_001166 [Verrucomicrobiales bacterium]|jgi:hypothetical protein
MTHPKLLILGLVLASLPPANAAPEKTERSLEAALVKTYSAWRDSMIEGDFEAWQEQTAAYRKAITRNNIVSQKLKFPDVLFTVPVKPASIDGMKPIQARAVGPTSQLVYYDQIDLGIEIPEGAEIPKSLLILKFIREAKGWKFNTLSLLNLKGAADIKAQVENKDYAFLDIGNFVPPGFVPPIPLHCPAPDYVAQIQVTSFGYDTEIIINGVSKHHVADTATSELIIGGLKQTPNEVTVRAKPIARRDDDNPDDDDIPQKLEITVFSVPKRKGADAIKSWHYEPRKVLPAYRGVFFAMPR